MRKKRITTNGYVQVLHDDKITNFNFSDYEYEHKVVAEKKVIKRKLKDGEVVHHLDSNRSNNSPDNLLVLEESQHLKLHAWMNKNVIIAKPKYQERKDLGCIRCLNCEFPVSDGFSFCSSDCCKEFKSKRSKIPSKEYLEKLIKEKPMTHIGKQFGVSDVAVRKWCKKLKIEIK